ncbi:MAG: hypothetical protein Q4B42_03615 [Oscillospiraceae bacterium]|nr:hypothetical protein [Oscillospiraceae bacterium]
MDAYKITEAELSGKGVVGLADTPRLTTEQMQQKFDEIAAEVIIPKHNSLVDKLETDFATKTDVSNAVFESRSSDMTKAVYDTDMDGVVNDSEKLGGEPPSYYAAAENALSSYESSLESYAVLPAGTTIYKDLEDLTDTQTLADETEALITGAETLSEVEYTIIEYSGAAAAVLASEAGSVKRVHALAGSGDNVKFTAAADFLEGDGFSVNGEVVQCGTADGEELPEGYFKSGAVLVCFKSGDKLNFKPGGSVSALKVQSYATEAALLADTPKDGTIGVVTETPITEWVFSTTQPTTRQDGSELSGGELWFKCGISSPAARNVLKKNSAWVYPNLCYQYVSGVWISKLSKTYQDGAWMEWSKYLYDKGDECLTIGGGGWTASGFIWGSNDPNPGLVTKNADHMLIGCASGAKTTVVGKSALIDVSGYRTLSLIYDVVTAGSGSNSVFLNVASNKEAFHTSSVAMARHNYPAVGNDYLLTGDISAVNDSYYIAVSTYDSGGTLTIRVKEVWLS